MDYRSLISEIQNLYSRIFARTLNFGKGLGKSWTRRRHNRDIASPLYAYLDRIEKKPEMASPAVHTPGPGSSTSIRKDVPTGNSARHPAAAQAPDLNNYYRSRKASTLLVPEIGQKLRDSAWTHLHEAIRYSRTGDMENARMHADLADGTLREAVQYMSRKDFEALLEEIKDRFEEMIDDTGV